MLGLYFLIGIFMGIIKIKNYFEDPVANQDMEI